MNRQLPSRRECHYVATMLEAGLVDHGYLEPWAEQIIAELDVAPPWLGDLATKRYRGELLAALREYIHAEPFEPAPDDLDEFHVGCLWLRYERSELSWASFPRAAGNFLDCVNGEWHCEIPYHYLNVVEDAYFSDEAERESREALLADLELRPWIRLAEETYGLFRRLMRAHRAEPGR